METHSATAPDVETGRFVRSAIGSMQGFHLGWWKTGHSSNENLKVSVYNKTLFRFNCRFCRLKTGLTPSCLPQHSYRKCWRIGDHVTTVTVVTWSGTRPTGYQSLVVTERCHWQLRLWWETAGSPLPAQKYQPPSDVYLWCAGIKAHLFPCVQNRALPSLMTGGAITKRAVGGGGGKRATEKMKQKQGRGGALAL